MSVPDEVQHVLRVWCGDVKGVHDVKEVLEKRGNSVQDTVETLSVVIFTVFSLEMVLSSAASCLIVTLICH